MMKSQIGLGVLSLPAAFDTLGYIPGIISLLVIATIATWSGYVLGKFKIRHPAVYSLDDCGELMFGILGRWVFAVAFCLCKSLLFIQVRILLC
jgi:amino acid permease